MTYKRVENRDEQRLFYAIVQEAWEEKNWDYEDIDRDGRAQYLIQNDEGDTIGTFEFLPYIPEGESLIERDYPFYKESEVTRQTRPVYELDKLAISDRHRSSEHLYILINDLLKVGIDELKSHLFLSIIRPSFHRLLHRVMKLPVIALTEPLYCDENDDYFTPCLCYVPKNTAELEAMQQTMRRGLRIKSLTK